ncbi:hypothetical protein EG329_013839 [Mollisiaceae sp. DMI_Dod_QoI]|nr:hypothetical protein EG329_013839 [Helotiales sp. DMI_Dod_QoI]
MLLIGVVIAGLICYTRLLSVRFQSIAYKADSMIKVQYHGFWPEGPEMPFITAKQQAAIRKAAKKKGMAKAIESALVHEFGAQTIGGVSSNPDNYMGEDSALGIGGEVDIWEGEWSGNIVDNAMGVDEENLEGNLDDESDCDSGTDSEDDAS